MTRSSLLIVVLVMLHFGAIGQAKLKDNQKEGYIITADGTKSEVAIEVEDPTQPWTFQSDVKYYDRSLLNGTRIKREQKSDAYPGGIIEYGFDNRRFLHVNYYIKGKGEDVFKSTVEKIKGDKATDFFAEVIHDGKIQLLKFYVPPMIAEEDYENEAVMKEYIKESEAGYDILIKKDIVGTKAIQEMNVKAYFEDCPMILNRFEKNLYKIKPKSGIKKLLSDDAMYGIKLENAALTVIRDYENKCAGK
jgi:hypothetical protein